jgi:hypothetical protein
MEAIVSRPLERLEESMIWHCLIAFALHTAQMRECPVAIPAADNDRSSSAVSLWITSEMLTVLPYEQVTIHAVVKNGTDRPVRAGIRDMRLVSGKSEIFVRKRGQSFQKVYLPDIGVNGPVVDSVLRPGEMMAAHHVLVFPEYRSDNGKSILLLTAPGKYELFWLYYVDGVPIASNVLQITVSEFDRNADGRACDALQTVALTPVLGRRLQLLQELIRQFPGSRFRPVAEAHALYFQRMNDELDAEFDRSINPQLALTDESRTLFSAKVAAARSALLRQDLDGAEKHLDGWMKHHPDFATAFRVGSEVALAKGLKDQAEAYSSIAERYERALARKQAREQDDSKRPK